MTFPEQDALMKEVIAWAGDSPSKWGALLEMVKGRCVPTLPFSLSNPPPREALMTWIGSQASFYKGIHNKSLADKSFYRRASSLLAQSVPQALALDHSMAKTLALKIRKDNTRAEVEEL
jgi:hypothetical protein